MEAKNEYQKLISFWSLLPCDSTEKKQESSQKVESQAEETTVKKEKVQQPIIGGYLGMILFEPNFFETPNQPKIDKG